MCCSTTFENTVVGVRFNLVMSALMEWSSSFSMFIPQCFDDKIDQLSIDLLDLWLEVTVLHSSARNLWWKNLRELFEREIAKISASQKFPAKRYSCSDTVLTWRVESYMVGQTLLLSGS